MKVLKRNCEEVEFGKNRIIKSIVDSWNIAYDESPDCLVYTIADRIERKCMESNSPITTSYIDDLIAEELCEFSRKRQEKIFKMRFNLSSVFRFAYGMELIDF